MPADADPDGRSRLGVTVSQEPADVLAAGVGLLDVMVSCRTSRVPSVRISGVLRGTS